MRNKRVLLLGNIKEDSSRSMKIYLNYLKRILPSVNVFEPSCGKVPVKVYKNFIYPFIIPKGYDIYHIIDHSYGHLARFLPKEKIVVTCHDLIPIILKKNSSFRAKFSFKYYSSGMKRAKKIIAVSENTKNDLIHFMGINPRKISVSYPWEIKKENFRAKKDKTLFPKKFKILSIGRQYYKNFILTLQALKTLEREIDNFKILKVGNLSKEEKEYAKNNNLTNKIEVYEKPSFKELIKLYNSADVLSFPSLYEGFGVPPLEAMAAGLPVVVSNSASLPEVVGDAAIKVNPKSFEGLAKAIKKIKENPKLRKDLIKKGYANLKRFTKEIEKKQISAIYNSFEKNPPKSISLK